MGQTMKCESEEDAKEPEAENEKPRLAHSELETMTEEQVEFYQISPIAHIILDESHRIIEANEAAARLFHTELGHMVSCQMLRFIAQKSYRDFVRHLSRVQKKGSDSTDLVMGRYGEPSFRAHVVTYSITKGGGIQGYHMVIEDFTDRKRIEKALKSSEEQFRRAIEDAPIPVIMQAEDGEVLQISHTWTELTGYSIDDLRSFDEWVTKAVYGEGANEVRDHLHQLFQGKKESIDIEFDVCSAKGEERHWSFSASSPGSLRDGRRFIVGMAVDVTERKRGEEALKRSNEELKQFAYVASHDLREPLRMISSYLELLEKKYESRLDDKAKEYINFAVDGAIRMQQLIDDVLAYSRVETKGKEFTEVDMNEVLATVLNDLRKSIEETGASITHDHLPGVFGDRAQMILLLENLIGNSIKFRDVAAPQIHVSSESKEADWVFSIEDNGIGIPKEQQKSLFQMFQRLHTREEYEGTGIGLALCKKIVERHGGQIWVESEEGKGSTFYFTIPKVMR